MNIFKIFFIANAMAVIMVFIVVPAYPAVKCATATECNNKGTAHYSKGNYSKAIPYFLRQLDIASGSTDEKQKMIALNYLALSYWKKGDKYFARAWIKEALTVGTYPYENSDKATRINSNKIFPSFNNENGQSAISGTYRRYEGYGKWSTLQIEHLSETTFKAYFDMVRYGLVPSAENYGPAAMGDIEGTGEIKGNELIFSYTNFTGKACKIIMAKKGYDIAINNHKYEDGCEFGGYNLYMDGVYMKTDIAVPEFKKIKPWE